MKDSLIFNGVVIYSAPVGENDRRMVLITREMGKITVFANGCRKATSPLAAFTRPFTFAKFNVYPGKNNYHLQSAEMVESFDGISGDYDALTYGTYFLELAGYFAGENVEAPEEVDLLYFTIKALMKKALPCKLIRAVFELKMLTIQGIAPNVFECCGCSRKVEEGYFLMGKHGIGCKNCFPENNQLIFLNKAALYAMQYVETVNIVKLYTFNLEPSALVAFCEAISAYYKAHVGAKFKSLEMIFD